MYISVTLEGGKELQDALDKLEKKVADKVVKKALKNSQQILLKNAKLKALSVVGGEMGSKIADAMRLKVGSKKIKGSFMYTVSLDDNPDFRYKTISGLRRVKIGKQGKVIYKKGDYYIPAAIEYGHIARDGSFVGPRSFMRTSDSQTQQQRIDNFDNLVLSEIKKIGQK